MILALRDEHVMLQAMAIIALGKIGNDIAIEPLKEIFENSDSFLRKEVILALEKICKEASLQPLLLALKDNSSKVRQLAAQKLLSKTTTLGIFPQSLLNGLKHYSITVRVESAKLLGSMTAKFNQKNFDYINMAVKPLINLLCNRKAYVRGSAVLTLHCIATHTQCIRENQTEIFSALKKLHNDQNPDVRNTVIKTLARLQTNYNF